MKGSSGGLGAGTALAYSISPEVLTIDSTYLSLNIDIYLSDMRCRWALLCVGIHSERCMNVCSGKSYHLLFPLHHPGFEAPHSSVSESTFGI